jgi:hypothetical protein
MVTAIVSRNRGKVKQFHHPGRDRLKVISAGIAGCGTSFWGGAETQEVL